MFSLYPYCCRVNKGKINRNEKDLYKKKHTQNRNIYIFSFFACVFVVIRNYFVLSFTDVSFVAVNVGWLQDFRIKINKQNIRKLFSFHFITILKLNFFCKYLRENKYIFGYLFVYIKVFKEKRIQTNEFKNENS